VPFVDSAYSLPDFIFPPTFAAHGAHPDGSGAGIEGLLEVSQHHHLLDSLSAPPPPPPAPAPPAERSLGLTGFGALPTTGAGVPALPDGPEIDFLGSGLVELPKELGDGLSWERLLSQLEEPQSALGEIRQFADQWWGFCQFATPPHHTPYQLARYANPLRAG